MNRKRIVVILIAALVALVVTIYFATIRKDSTLENKGGVGGSVFSQSSDTFPDSVSAPENQFAENVSQNSESINVSFPRLRHLTDQPTSGDVVIIRQVDVIKDRVKTKEKQYFVRYIDRASGHISEIKTDSPAAFQISNTTIPKVYEAIFTPDGNSLIARLLSDVNPDQILTYHIALKDRKDAASSTGSAQSVANIGAQDKSRLKDVSGTYLEPDIKEISLSPSGARALYLTYTADGGKLTLSGSSGSGARVVLTHPLREWQLFLQNENRALLVTKPSGIVNGFAYTLNLADGSLSKITGEIAGLTILPNKDGDIYLGAGTPENSVVLFVYQNGNITILPIATFPEKCVWSRTTKSTVYCAVPEVIPQATYPDSWYQGRVSFSDRLWKINITTGETNLISNLPEESGQKIDAINLKLAEDDSYITFINKVDLTLWGLDLLAKQ